MKSISQDKNQYIKRTKLKVQNEKYNKRKEEKSRAKNPNKKKTCKKKKQQNGNDRGMNQ